MIRSGLCHSYKKEILRGVHREDHRYMLALFTNDADLTPDTEAYSASGEVRGDGYSPGGVSLSGFSVTGSKVGCLDFDDVTIKRTTIAADGGLIYNASAGNRAVAVVRFAERITSTNGPFFIEMPRVGEATSVVRIA